MRRYFFVLAGPGETHDDHSGTLLASDGAAQAYAERIVRELKSAGGYDDPQLKMIVQDAARQILFTIPFPSQAAAPGDDPHLKPLSWLN